MNNLTESDIRYLRDCVLSSTLLGHQVKKGSKVLRKLDQALSIANVSERFFINIYQDEEGKFISDEEYVSFADAQENRDEVWTYIETVEVIRNAR